MVIIYLILFHLYNSYFSCEVVLRSSRIIKFLEKMLPTEKSPGSGICFEILLESIVISLNDNFLKSRFLFLRNHFFNTSTYIHFQLSVRIGGPIDTFFRSNFWVDKFLRS